MAKVKRGLGKGLGAFFGEEVVQEVAREKDNGQKTADSTGIGAQESKEQTTAQITVRLSKIEPNPEQPRKDFPEEQLQELADSIRQYGILQPLLVQPKGERYEIIAGERRWRAAKLAGIKEVPVVIREYSRGQAMEIALIENVQREDLNPLEEAKAYQCLMQEFHLKQEEIAIRVSKNRTTITNSLRLLKLDPEVQQMLAENQLSNGHARALLAVEDPQKQRELAVRIVDEGMSVRSVEKAVKQLTRPVREKKKTETDTATELIFQNIEHRLKEVMGTKVTIARRDSNKGKIEIEYYSKEDLERIIEMMESMH